jgi:adenylate cyclase
MKRLADGAVDLERENAELRRQLTESLAQQAATAEVLQVINSSPGDLAPVFDAMLDKAMSLCGAAFGVLWTYDGRTFCATASRGAPPAYAEFLASAPHQPGPNSAHGRLLRGSPAEHISDVASSEDYRFGDPFPRALVELAGGRTILAVPLRKDDVFLGDIFIYRHEVRPFSDQQIALLQNFAAQAVIAIESARLLTETREALAQQTATAEVLQVINSSPGDVMPVFDAMLEKAMLLCDAAYGHLRIFDGEVLNPVAIRGAPGVVDQFRRLDTRAVSPASPSGRIIAGARIVHIPDLKEVYGEGDDAPSTLLEIGGARTVLSVALRREDTLLGAITLYRQEVRPFLDRQVALLENFAAQAVIAMENARLLGELRQRTEEVAGLNRDLEARVAAQLDELGRIGNLKRFLPPQVAEMVVTHGNERILESHRREIVVVFADVREYTAFTETAEPEEVIDFLGQYHAALGPLITRFEGTLSHFLGDGLMVFFNDPIPCPDPAERAVRMALAMRAAAGELVAVWRRRGYRIGFGVGIAQGYATLGQIGFADRSDYTAIGTVTNLAARLCGEAKDGQILISRRIAAAVEDCATLEEIGDVSLKGLSQAVAVYNVVEATPPL